MLLHHLEFPFDVDYMGTGNYSFLRISKQYLDIVTASVPTLKAVASDWEKWRRENRNGLYSFVVIYAIHENL